MNISLFKSMCASALCITAMATASAKDANIDYPQRLYVINWTEQSSADDILFDRTYGLGDEDGDGIYTGTFRTSTIPMNGLVLQFYAGSICDFDKEEVWGPNVDDQHSVNLYSDMPLEYSLESAEDKTVGFIPVQNYANGFLNVSVDWNVTKDGVHTPLVKISSPDQPKFGFKPNELYIIGDFNGFRIPDNGDPMGAYTLTRSQATEGLLYSAELDIPAGTKEFMIFAPALADRIEAFFGIKDFPGITLCRPSTSEPATFVYYLTEETTASDTAPDGLSIKLRDWAGGKISFTFDAERNRISLSTNDAPVIDGNISLYVKTPTKTSKIEDLSKDEYYSMEEDCEIWGSTADTGVWNASDSWGTPELTVIDLEPIEGKPFRKVYPIVKGGQPLKFIVAKGKKNPITTSFNVYNGYVTVSAYTVGSGESAVNVIKENTDDTILFIDGIVKINEITDIFVYDMSGFKVASAKAASLDLNSLPAGMYIVTAAGKTAKILI